MTDAELAALEAAIEGHTAGPWHLQQVDYGLAIYAGKEEVLSGVEEMGDTHVAGYRQDLELACAAPELLAEVRRLRAEEAELARLAKVLAEARKQHAHAFRQYEALPEAEKAWDHPLLWESRRASHLEREAREALLAEAEGASDGS